MDWRVSSRLGQIENSSDNCPNFGFPDMEKPFILTCDASRSGLGYILGHLDHEGKERVIEYNGRSSQAAEKNYSATELECLAIVQGIKTFKAYLHVSTGRKFTIVTDHKALKTLNTLNTSTNDRIARWHMLLTGYRYEVVYRKGENNNADILSRIPENIGENGKDKAIESISSNSRVTLNEVNCNENIANKSHLHAESCSLDTEKNNLMKIPPDATQIENKEWLEVTLEYGDQINVCSLESDENSDLNQEVNAPKFKDFMQLQKECPDFKHIYAYLENGTIPEEDKLKKNLEIRKEYYQLVDGILLHLFQNRAKKKPTDELS